MIIRLAKGLVTERTFSSVAYNVCAARSPASLKVGEMLVR